MSASSTISGSTTTIRYNVDTTNPLQAFSPAINGEMTVKLTPRAWTLTGKHDLMPVHQFMWGPQLSEYKISYSTHDFYTLVCLYGGPVCTAKVNVQL